MSCVSLFERIDILDELICAVINLQSSVREDFNIRPLILELGIVGLWKIHQDRPLGYDGGCRVKQDGALLY